MKKVLTIFGTRPEAIKMAPLVNLLAADENFELLVAVTAQHRVMLDQVLELFSINPDYDLNIMKEGQDLFDITSNALTGLKSILTDLKPDVILVHGDTSTTLAAALGAFYCKIPVGYVEAGLRTYDKNAPWPEEINRQLTTKLATWHFVPTEQNRKNLLKEQIEEDKICLTGNTVVDALFWVLKKIENDFELQQKIEVQLEEAGLNLDDLDGQYILITGHRRENWGDNFENICRALKALASKFPNVNFIYPVHLNPIVREPVFKILGNLRNVNLINPVRYEAFVWLIKKCYLILTDSGGLQEEGPSLGKPVLVMRNTTERPEAVLSGTAILVGTTEDGIYSSVSKIISDVAEYKKMSKAHNPFGDGSASLKIRDFLRSV